MFVDAGLLCTRVLLYAVSVSVMALTMVIDSSRAIDQLKCHSPTRVIFCLERPEEDLIKQAVSRVQ